MPLLKLDQAYLAYGTHVLLDHVDLTLFRGQRIGLLGRNGAGKSTLLKVIGQSIKIDSGEYWQRPGVKVATLAQELPDADDQSVFEVVAAGLHPVGELLVEYQTLIEAAEPDMKRLEKVQHQLETLDGWSMQTRVDTTLSQLGLNGDAQMSTLSGGWRRRVALARALVIDPDILLLDEPTNHLDLPAIEWLEGQLKAFQGTILFITHDREFLQSVADHIFELDRGHLRCWTGDYQGFLAYREQQLAAEERANELFDKKLAQEEVWIRQGIKARRTRNEGRVRALKAMRSERSDRREVQGNASFGAEKADASGKLVAELKNVTVSYEGRDIIQNFNSRIMRGDRIGIIGANGAGKSTLIKTLLGRLEPNEGTITMGTKLEVAYFDQLRASLDPEKNLVENVCEGRDFIELNGVKRHGISYLSDFLFTPDRLRVPVKALSGGEQNRAILAQLFSKPANLLVLDEPTNDLDMETLELLEDILLKFEGTLLLVSHDRSFMNNVVTSTMALTGDAIVREYVGGYDDWIRQGGRLAPLDQQPKAPKAKPVEAPVEVAPAAPAKKRKLSYKDQRELDQLPALIDALETEVAEFEDQASHADFYAQGVEAYQPVLDRMAKAQEALDAAMERWIELSED